MRRNFKLENLECANCASKMEADIAKLDGVDSASIAFMTGRLTINFVDGADVDDVLDKAQDLISKYEKDCTIVR